MKSGQYSKWLVALVIFLNVAFAAGVMWSMTQGAVEPKTLITAWFGWTTVELGATTYIKKKKIEADCKKIQSAGKDSDEKPED